MRFVAITMVVFFHLAVYLRAKSPIPYPHSLSTDAAARLLSVGHYGVQLFFIVSGFVLALPFALHHLHGENTVSLRAYLLRRVTRLEPPYVLSMVLFFGILAIGPASAQRGSLPPHLLASLAYVHNAIYATGSTINVVAWSLEIEVQFYLLAPAMSVVFAIKNTAQRRAAIVLMIVCCLLLSTFYASIHPRTSKSLLNYAQFFLLGFLLVDLYLLEWQRGGLPPRARWDLLALVGWPLLFWMWMRVPEPALSLCWPAVAFALFCATFRGPRTSRAFSLTLVTTIGGMCYTIYLLHYPLISAFVRHTIGIATGTSFRCHVMIQALLFVPILLLASLTYFVLIERPCMDRHWPRRLIDFVARRRVHLGDASASPPPGAV